MANNFEKKDYTKGDVGKMIEADARAEALKSGRIRQFEDWQKAAETGQLSPLHRKIDYKAGDPQKLEAARKRLESLYPKKPEAKNLEMPEDKAA